MIVSSLICLMLLPITISYAAPPTTTKTQKNTQDESLRSDAASVFTAIDEKVEAKIDEKNDLS